MLIMSCHQNNCNKLPDSMPSSDLNIHPLRTCGIKIYDQK